VSYTRDLQRGTAADLLLMPEEAFTPERNILMPTFPDPSQLATPVKP
jgi:hypothetical protein